MARLRKPNTTWPTNISTRCHTSQLQASASKLIGAAFDAFDLNADGKISESEYMAFLEVHGNPKGAEDTWPRLDTNHDGHLARDEFVNLMFELLRDR